MEENITKLRPSCFATEYCNPEKRVRQTFIATSFLIKNNTNGTNNRKIIGTCTTTSNINQVTQKQRKELKNKWENKFLKSLRQTSISHVTSGPKQRAKNELFQTMSLSKKCFNNLLFPILVLLPEDKSCLWVEPIVTSLFLQALFGLSHLSPSLLPLPFQVAMYLLALFHP